MNFPAHNTPAPAQCTEAAVLAHLLRICYDAQAGFYGPLSTGERLAAALVLNRPDLIAQEGYTLAQAISRIGPVWASLLLTAQEELERTTK